MISVFEYDRNKSAENKRKHGLDSEEAQELCADSGLMEIPARKTDEPRWLLVGKIDQKRTFGPGHAQRRMRMPSVDFSILGRLG